MCSLEEGECLRNGATIEPDDSKTLDRDRVLRLELKETEELNSRLIVFALLEVALATLCQARFFPRWREAIVKKPRCGGSSSDEKDGDEPSHSGAPTRLVRRGFSH